MSHHCNAYRLKALDDLGSSIVDCAACAAWERQQVCLVSELVGLTRLTAPTQLQDRCAIEFSLRDLPTRKAPSALDARVQRLALRVAEESPTERTVRGLTAVAAPNVLERLVAEELLSGERAQARRFAGDLPRLATPDGLRQRLQASPTGGSGRRIRRVGAAAASLAAAVLLFVGLRLDAEAPKRTYRFEVVEATSLDQLSPFAQGFVDMASGGLTRALPDAGHTSEQDG